MSIVKKTPSTTEGTKTNAEQAFARLEELVAQLPSVQKEDARLMRAREARCLLKARNQAKTLEAEIENYQQIISRALVDAKAASDQQNEEEEGRNLALVRMYTELRYTRLAIMQRAQDKLRDLLKQSTHSLDDPLDEYALSDEDYEALEAQVRDFQEEYQHLYDLCCKLEGLK
jgi:uncharacterized protein YecE (DUF72 family)